MSQGLYKCQKYNKEQDTNLAFVALQASQIVLVVKNLLAKAGNLRDTSLSPEWRRAPGGGNGDPLQYSCLENPMNRGAWRATVHSITKSQT